MNKIVNTSNAPAPIGPYNQAVWAGNILFMSGQIALDAATGELVLTDIPTETRKVLENIKAVLTEAGLDFSNIVKAQIFLKDLGDFAVVNEIYSTYFTGNYPARDTIQVAALPKNVNVEISVVAYKA
ncbi:RidA family protein [Mucilaginibacter terrae]|uniref:2-iminobutanoate/2-iminopropanoate deaminase n=1 Tax=Mucilaginibacter terrae TaxID=1955052 RepID=A0ABU3GVQ7_9SPHI|nr:RidA family protein [Mucilaginibacter terrae]MDT3403863.1 2-iminobutanoate/2-iminopropanoate deaminase [Mucilaginibacter terrae]